MLYPLPKGCELTIIRHNEIYDLTATLRTEVVHDVQIEPDLQPLTIEHLACASANFQDAWCETRHSGKWGLRWKIWKDIFQCLRSNPLATSNRKATCQTSTIITRQLRSGFTTRGLSVPPKPHYFFSATGGLGSQAFWHILHQFEKWNHRYSSTFCWLCCRLTFSILRSVVQSIRGTRSSTRRCPPYPRIFEVPVNTLPCTCCYALVLFYH